MSDLISRSKLLKEFNNKGIQITFDLPVEEILGEDVDIDDFTMLMQDAIQAYKKMVIDTIKNQQTAYDVDKVIKESAEEYNGGWIPCSERLPEEPFGCLVTVIDCEPVTQNEFENILPYHVGYDGHGWIDADGEEIPFEVIAWQPLPEPYKERED